MSLATKPSPTPKPGFSGEKGNLTPSWIKDCQRADESSFRINGHLLQCVKPGPHAYLCRYCSNDMALLWRVF